MTNCTECGIPVSGREADFACCEDCQRAAYNAQYASLNLTPWHEPPCVVDPYRPIRGTEQEKQMMRLLREMLALGISRYHHDPVRAITEARKRRKG